MKLRILAITLTLLMASGCASKQYQLGVDPNMANACGQSVDVAIEGGASVDTTASDCQQMERSASAGNNGGGLLLQIFGYAAGFALGMALF